MMRFQFRLVVCIGLYMLGVGVLTGCSMMGQPRAADRAVESQTQTEVALTQKPQVQQDQVPEDDLNAKIQAHADQLLAAIERQQAQARQKKLDQKNSAFQEHSSRVQNPQMDRLAGALEYHARSGISAVHASSNLKALPQVQWLDLQPVPKPVAQVPQVQKTTPPLITPKVPILTVANTGLDADLDTVRLSQKMAQSIRKSSQTPLQKALAISSLSLSSNHSLLEPYDLNGLSPDELGQVRKMHRMVLQTLAKQMKKSEQNADQQAGINDQLGKLFGTTSVQISRVEFCRTVSGYGVYDPFESTTFLAGVEQPLILYVELENFGSIHDGSQYRVALTQEVELYTDADGVRVWSLPREQIVDVSRNKRRDFFTVQLLHLPARLGVGKYRLKVRIHDLNGNSYDETTVLLTLVASESTTARKDDTKSLKTREN